MAYTPTVWKNGEFPPIDAEHLNKIEQGIANSAPGGFGLGGGSKLLTPDDDLNDVWENGSYAWDAAPKNAPTVGGSLIPYCSMQVINKGSSYNMHQIARTFEDYEIRRYYDGATKTWSEWAWANPPMMAGVEYQTTEFYLGKPVYVKLTDLGEGVNGKTVNVGTTEMIHVECRATYSSWSLPMPELPFGSTDRSLENTSAQAFYSNANTVTIIKGSTCPAFTATAKVYYTKATD